MFQAYQDAFRRLDEDGDRWRHLVDGILVLDPGEFLHPAVQSADGLSSRVILNNVIPAALPPGTIVGLMSEAHPDDAGDACFETIRSYLMRFKNPSARNESLTVRLALNDPLGTVTFKRCCSVRRAGGR